MNRRNLLLFGSLAVSAGVAIFGDRTPTTPATVEAAPRGPAAAPTPASVAPPARTSGKHPAPAILALLPRRDLIDHPAPSEPPALFGTRALFETAAAPAADSASTAPAIPALPFTYLGKKLENGKWEIFLAIGERTYFAREGTVIDDTYVVNSIKPPVMTLTFLPQKEQQTLSIGADQ